MTKTPRKKIQPFDYSELDLEPDKLAIVKRCEAELAKLGRRTTEETFEFGEQLAIAAELIPERTFGKWAVSAFMSANQFVDQSEATAAIEGLSAEIRFRTARSKALDQGFAQLLTTDFPG